MRALGWSKTPGQYEMLAKTLQERSLTFRKAIQGFAGWLITNPDFLRERDAFLEKWAVNEQFGLPPSGANRSRVLRSQRAL